MCTGSVIESAGKLHAYGIADMDVYLIMINFCGVHLINFIIYTYIAIYMDPVKSASYLYKGSSKGL